MNKVPPWNRSVVCAVKSTRIQRIQGVKLS
jgi:hypothetical protein